MPAAAGGEPVRRCRPSPAQLLPGLHQQPLLPAAKQPLPAVIDQPSHVLDEHPPEVLVRAGLRSPLPR